jgi:hypothetical protein
MCSQDGRKADREPVEITRRDVDRVDRRALPKTPCQIPHPIVDGRPLGIVPPSEAFPAPYGHVGEDSRTLRSPVLIDGHRNQRLTQAGGDSFIVQASLRLTTSDPVRTLSSPCGQDNLISGSEVRPVPQVAPIRQPHPGGSSGVSLGRPPGPAFYRHRPGRETTNPVATACARAGPARWTPSSLSSPPYPLAGSRRRAHTDGRQTAAPERRRPPNRRSRNAMLGRIPASSSLSRSSPPPKADA